MSLLEGKCALGESTVGRGVTRTVFLVSLRTSKLKDIWGFKVARLSGYPECSLTASRIR